MPVLKSYTDGSGHYIHASVRGAVVTFQTTTRGVEKLAGAGVQSGVRFALRLLADLRRWYAEDASAEWERLRRERDQRQQGFAFDVPGELKF